FFLSLAQHILRGLGVRYVANHTYAALDVAVVVLEGTGTDANKGAFRNRRVPNVEFDSIGLFPPCRFRQGKFVVRVQFARAWPIDSVILAQIRPWVIGVP